MAMPSFSNDLMFSEKEQDSAVQPEVSSFG